MAEIRIASCKEDFCGIRKIWEERFTTDKRYLDTLFNKIMPHCRSYIHCQNGEILSVISLMPMIHLTKDGSTGNNGWYMFGVATQKRSEGNKLAATLIKTAEQELKSENYSFLFERPANQSLNKYYLNLGFSVSIPKLPYNFRSLESITKQEGQDSNTPDKNVKSLSKAILEGIITDFDKKFVWGNKEILEGLINLGELREHIINYTSTPNRDETYIAVNPLGSPNPETYKETFFCFPME